MTKIRPLKELKEQKTRNTREKKLCSHRRRSNDRRKDFSKKYKIYFLNLISGKDCAFVTNNIRNIPEVLCSNSFVEICAFSKNQIVLIIEKQFLFKFRRQNRRRRRRNLLSIFTYSVREVLE